MTEKELKESVKAPEGGYFFYGDEDYLKDYYISLIRRAVITDESVADFNEICLDDENFSPSALEDAVAALPLMSDKKLIKIKLSSYDSLPEKDRKATVEILSDLPSDTVIIISIAAGGFDPGSEKKPTASMKTLAPIIKCVAFPLGQEPKLVRWLSRHFAERGVVSDEASLRLMLNLCGRSMHRLALEAEKVASRALSSGIAAISPALVESTVTVTVEEDAFRLANSVLEGNTAAALDCIARAKRRNESPVKLLASVTATFCDLAAIAHLAAEGADKKEISLALKIHEYRVGLYMKAASGVPTEILDDAVAMCAEADAKMKSMSLGYVPLERLICSVRLH